MRQRVANIPGGLFVSAQTINEDQIELRIRVQLVEIFIAGHLEVASGRIRPVSIARFPRIVR